MIGSLSALIAAMAHGSMQQGAPTAPANPAPPAPPASAPAAPPPRPAPPQPDAPSPNPTSAEGEPTEGAEKLLGEIWWDCWVGRRTIDRLASALELDDAGRTTLDSVYQAHRLAVLNACAKRSRESDEEIREAERLLDAKLDEDAQRDDLSEIERFRLKELRRRRDAGECPAFGDLPNDVRNRIADTNTTVYWRIEIEHRARLASEIAKGLGLDDDMRDRIWARLTVDGAGEGWIATHSDSKVPRFWCDFYRCVRDELKTGGTLAVLGDASLALRPPAQEDPSSLSARARAVLVTSDRATAMLIDDWLRTRAALRGSMDARTRDLASRRLATGRELAELLPDTDAVAAPRTAWMKRFHAAMLPWLYAPRDGEDAVARVIESIAPDDPRRPDLTSRLERLRAECDRLRLEAAPLLWEKAGFSRGLSNEDAKSISQLAELEAAPKRMIDEVRAMLTPDEQVVLDRELKAWRSRQ